MGFFKDIGKAISGAAKSVVQTVTHPVETIKEIIKEPKKIIPTVLGTVGNMVLPGVGAAVGSLVGETATGKKINTKSIATSLLPSILPGVGSAIGTAGKTISNLFEKIPVAGTILSTAAKETTGLLQSAIPEAISTAIVKPGVGAINPIDQITPIYTKSMDKTYWENLIAATKGQTKKISKTQNLKAQIGEGLYKYLINPIETGLNAALPAVPYLYGTAALAGATALGIAGTSAAGSTGLAQISSLLGGVTTQTGGKKMAASGINNRMLKQLISAGGSLIQGVTGQNVTGLNQLAAAAGLGLRRHRRINPTNVKALKRSTRRLISFQKISTKVERSLSKLVKHRRVRFTKIRRK